MNVFALVFQEFHLHVVHFGIGVNLVRLHPAQLRKQLFDGLGSPALYLGIEDLLPLFPSMRIHLFVA